MSVASGPTPAGDSARNYLGHPLQGTRDQNTCEFAQRQVKSLVIFFDKNLLIL